jgi:hypothetical protein
MKCVKAACACKAPIDEVLDRFMVLWTLLFTLSEEKALDPPRS